MASICLYAPRSDCDPERGATFLASRPKFAFLRYSDHFYTVSWECRSFRPGDASKVEITSPTAARKGVAVPGQKRRKHPPGAGPFNKLAQRVNSGAAAVTEDDIRLNQQSKFSAKEAFQKRARVKYLTTALSVRLANIEGSPLTKSYWNTFYCSSVMQKKGDHLTAKFCKNRWCLVCNRIRTAQLIKQYLPTIQSWEEKYFVTLTVPNCPGEELQATIKEMKVVFNRIRQRITMQFRGKKRAAQLVGLRKLETTYNVHCNNYHPHFHLIVNDRAVADDLRKYWLTHFQEASWDNQDVKKADNGSVMELMKYFTKIISSKSKERLILVEPLDVIFQAVAGERTFQAFNVKVTKETTDEEAEALAEELSTEAIYEWSQLATDWVDIETGELLTRYEPDPQFRALVEKRIITNPPAPRKGS